MFDFKTGNTAGMNTTAAVIIKAVFLRKSGAVCMAGDQDMVLLFGPMMEPLFCFVFSRIIFSCAGRIENAEMLQRFP